MHPDPISASAAAGPGGSPGPVTEDFTVSVAGGGGPDLFRAALRRKFAELTRRGSHCVILERTFVESHYVQTILTPVGAFVEAVGDTYLGPVGVELTAAQVAVLETSGWLAPSEPGDDQDDGTTRNWWCELGGRGFLKRTVDQLLVALIDVYGLESVEPVHIEIFPSDHQCWEWVPDPDSPCRGELEPLD